jgi:hypothetical protein
MNEMAVRFRKLHEPSAKLLVLPNAWDADKRYYATGIDDGTRRPLRDE